MKSGLLAIGLTTLDIVARPIDALTHTERASYVDGIACVPAGTAAGAAMVAAKLGLSVTLVGAVGDDMIGGFVRLGLDSAGVDTRLLATRAGVRTSTTLLAVESDGRRSAYHMMGAGTTAAVIEDVLEAARQVRFLHYGAIGGLATDGGPGEALLRVAKEAGATVTCDLISPRPNAPDEIRRLMPFVDFFMPSAAEALSLSGSPDLYEAAAHFQALGAKACVIKNGTAGSVVAMGKERHQIPAYAVEAVDTTSCGDSFCAGFIAALDRGWAPLDACRFASMTAAQVAQGLGTLGKLRGFDDTAMAMSAHKTQAVG